MYFSGSSRNAQYNKMFDFSQKFALVASLYMYMYVYVCIYYYDNAMLANKGDAETEAQKVTLTTSDHHWWWTF